MHDPTRTPDDDARLVAKLLTIADVAKLSGLSDKSVRRAIERGDLRALKLCNRVRIEPAAVADWHRASQLDEPRPTEPAHRPRPRRIPQRAKPPTATGGLRELLDPKRED